MGDLTRHTRARSTPRPCSASAASSRARWTARRPTSVHVDRVQGLVEEEDVGLQDKRAGELDALLELYEQRRPGFRRDPGRAGRLLSAGEAPRDESLDPVEVASLDVVVGAIMNYDASVTKR